MKTMTCQQGGGPCDRAHVPANADMRGRWKRPVKGLGWYRQAKLDFDALPED